MGIKAITVYESEDGKIHKDIAAARAYNAQQKSMAAIVTAIKKADPNFSLGTLHITLANNPAAATELRDSLNKVLEYHRIYGKLKK